MKLLYLDVETGGLDPSRNPIIQISGIITITEDLSAVTREFDFKIRPNLSDPSVVIEDQALAVNGITREQLLDPERLEPKDVYKKLKSIFLTYIDRYDKQDKFYLVGQNVNFDYSFLLALWKSQGDDYLGSFIHHNKIDLIALTASMKLAGVFKRPEAMPNMKLATLCKYFELGEQSHDSMDDIRKTREIFVRMIKALKSGGLSL